MLYLKKVKEILEGSQMSLSCKFFRLFVKLRKVFIVFGREIMKDLRQAKRHISALGTGRNGVLWKKHALRNGIPRFN